ncbi:DUF192 domain-containing protein [Mycolicibacterium thermoresistibile]
MRRAVVGMMIVSLALGCSDARSTDEADPTAATLLPAIEVDDPDAPPVRHRQFRLTLRAPDEDRTVQFRVYDAADEVSRTRGLMGVTDLPGDAGMLFRFTEPRSGGFWMKNTLLPLSIAYADSDGVITTILDMEPCRTDPCPSYRPDVPYRYALEVNRGEFAARGVGEGWRIDIPADLPPPPGG